MATITGARVFRFTTAGTCTTATTGRGITSATVITGARGTAGVVPVRPTRASGITITRLAVVTEIVTVRDQPLEPGRTYRAEIACRATGIGIARRVPTIRRRHGLRRIMIDVAVPLAIRPDAPAQTIRPVHEPAATRIVPGKLERPRVTEPAHRTVTPIVVNAAAAMPAARIFSFASVTAMFGPTATVVPGEPAPRARMRESPPGTEGNRVVQHAPVRVA